MIAITHHSYLRWLHTQGIDVDKKNMSTGIYYIEKGWLQMVRNCTETISNIVLPLANRIMWVKRLDLYNKSRVMGDYQARF